MFESLDTKIHSSMAAASREASAETNAETQLEKRWHSAASRLLFIYALAFSLSIAILFGFLNHILTGELERLNDRVMIWQLTYMSSVPADKIADIIEQRVEKEVLHTAYYGLFSGDGKWIAGDVLRFPASMPLHRGPLTLEHTLDVSGNGRAPVTRVLADRLPNGEILLIARDLTHIREVRRNLSSTLIVVGLFCLLAGIAGGVVMGAHQRKRLRSIRRVTFAISQGDLNQRLPTGGHDEIDMLSHLVNHMLDEIERLMHEVKGACDGIAHDLRTPLAHLHALLSRVQDEVKQYSNKTVDSLVEHARGETDALLERFRAMLRISEIGALQRRGGFDEVDLKALIRDVADLYEPLADRNGISLLVLSDRVQLVHGDRSLLFEALSNIVDNAVKFTPRGGRITVSLISTPKGPQIDVVDDGPGIGEEDRHAVMQRFYRGEKTRHIAGSGLGLSIVSAVLGVHDFSAHIVKADRGTHFVLECWSHTLA